MKDPRLDRAGVAGFNKPKRLKDGSGKSHIVVAKSGSTIKTISHLKNKLNKCGPQKMSRDSYANVESHYRSLQ